MYLKLCEKQLKQNRKFTKNLQKTKKTTVADFIRKKEKKFFNNLNPSFVKGNNIFWKTIELFFSDKGNLRSQIKLI